MKEFLTLALGYVLDLALFRLFSHPYRIKKSRLMGLFVPVMAAYSVYRLFYGRGSGTQTLQDILVLFSEIGISFLALRSLYDTPWKAAAAESVIFVLALNVGRKLFFHIELSFLPPALGTSQVLCQLMATANKLILVLSVRPRSRDEYDGNVTGQELFLLLFALFNCVVLSLLNVTRSDSSRLLNLDMVCYLSAFVCALAVKQFARMNGRVRAMEAMRREMDLQYELYAKQKENDETVRRMYHDLRHQLKAIENTGGSAAALAQSMSKQLKAIHPVVYTSRPILNAVLNEEQRKAESLGIAFRLESGLGSFDFMQDYDLVSLFSNALDNAVEAASACAEGNRTIRLRYTEKPAYRLTVIENTFEGARITDGGRLLTTKPDKEYHGIGSQSIRTVAEKYGGTCRYEMKDGIFSLSILLPEPKADPPALTES